MNTNKNSFRRNKIVKIKGNLPIRAHVTTSRRSVTKTFTGGLFLSFSSWIKSDGTMYRGSAVSQ